MDQFLLSSKNLSQPDKTDFLWFWSNESFYCWSEMVSLLFLLSLKSMSSLVVVDFLLFAEDTLKSTVSMTLGLFFVTFLVDWRVMFSVGGLL